MTVCFRILSTHISLVVCLEEGMNTSLAEKVYGSPANKFGYELYISLSAAINSLHLLAPTSEGKKHQIMPKPNLTPYLRTTS